MNALPVISLDGSTVVRHRRVTHTHMFGVVLRQPLETAIVTWQRPHRAPEFRGHITTGSHCFDVAEVVS